MAAPQPNPTQTNPFLALQRKQAFYLATFRVKGRSPLPDELNLANRLPVPKRSFFRGLKQYTQRRPRPWAYDETANPLGVGNRDNAPDAKIARIRLQTKLLRYGLTLVHTLGWGGNGLAALFSLPGQNGRPTEYFVAKCPLRGSAAAIRLLQDEGDKHRTYRGALHIVQQKLWPRPVNPQQHPRRPINVLLLEYLRNGDLHNMLVTITQRRSRIPDRALWSMFHCLVQGCIALEFPPQTHPQLGPHMDAQGLVNGRLSSELTLNAPAGSLERWNCTGGRPGGGSGMVHWDIDPQNVMLGLGGGPPGDDHHIFPVLKLGDLGHAMQMTQNAMDDSMIIWRARTRSKLEYLTPEQFSEEWDWVVRDPRRCFPLVKTAGKYSHLTNLYQLALVMACAITSSYPQIPLVHTQMEIKDPNNTASTITVWTYGGFLLGHRYRHTDIRLRRVVAQCLCAEPKHRPHIDVLKRAIKDHLSYNRWKRHDGTPVINQWALDVLGHPPGPPAPPVPPYWVDTPQGTALPP